MKKILLFLFLGAVGFTAYSCDNDDDVVVQNPVDYDTFPQMRDVNVTLNSANGYAHVEPLGIENTDVVLVYRKDVSANNAWQLIPKTYYLTGGRELDYNFLFSTQKVEIYTEGLDQSTLSTAEKNEFLNNQTFRIVLVPASAAKNAQASVDYSDYNAVVKYYNLDETKVKAVKIN